MAMRMTLLSMRSPNADTGRAWSHAPDSFLQAARRRAHAGASGAAAWIALKVASTRGGIPCLMAGLVGSWWRWFFMPHTPGSQGGFTCLVGGVLSLGGSRR